MGPSEPSLYLRTESIESPAKGSLLLPDRIHVSALSIHLFVWFLLYLDSSLLKALGYLSFQVAHSLLPFMLTGGEFVLDPRDARASHYRWSHQIDNTPPLWRHTQSFNPHYHSRTRKSILMPHQAIAKKAAHTEAVITISTYFAALSFRPRRMPVSSSVSHPPYCQQTHRRHRL